MEQSLMLAVPAFVLFMLAEKIASMWIGKDVMKNHFDVISSLSSGAASVIIGAMGIGVTLVSYDWLVENVAIWQFDYHSPLVWLMVILSLDFGNYWVHRINHKYNFFWQLHIVHHSSEEFNLPVALRQSATNRLLNLFTVFYLPMALLGIPLEITAVVTLLHLYYQYSYHTQFFQSLGWLERIIVKPQQHRIHHAINPEYIDKNFDAWFRIWDHMMGTFEQ